MNKLEEKKQKLAEISEKLKCGFGRVENIGSVFFLYHTGACVLRDVVYYHSKRCGVEFESLCMTSSYFIGSKEHAEALKEAYGGEAYPTEYCFLAENARNLYAWEGPKRYEQLNAGFNAIPLDIEDIKTILF